MHAQSSLTVVFPFFPLITQSVLLAQARQRLREADQELWKRDATIATLKDELSSSQQRVTQLSTALSQEQKVIPSLIAFAHPAQTVEELRKALALSTEANELLKAKRKKDKEQLKAAEKERVEREREQERERERERGKERERAPARTRRGTEQ